MAVGDRFKSFVQHFTGAPAPESPWHPRQAAYPLLAAFDPAAAGLADVPGLVAIWHLGVRPQWLKVAAVADLAAGVRSAAAAPPLMAYKPNGGVYVAWARLQPPAVQGHAVYLTVMLRPALQAVPLATELIAPPDTPPLDLTLPPGTGEP